MKKILLTLLLVLMAIGITGCNGINIGKKTEYHVSDQYFTYNGFKPTILNKHDFVTGIIEQTPQISVNAICEYELISVSVSVKMYDEGGNLLKSSTNTKSNTIKANSKIDFDFIVSATIQNKTDSVVAVFSGKSYTEPKVSTGGGSNQKTYKVTFVYNNGSSNTSKTVVNGNTVEKPATPIKNSYIFSSWYIDSELTKEYDFSQKVTKNITLYAKYIVDYAYLTNKITKEIMSANVTINARSYSDFLWVEYKYAVSTGSGIIFFEDSRGNYYVLTNCHVTVKKSGYDKIKHTIEDHKGNTYSATLVAEDPEYDLAVLYFKKSTTLSVIQFANNNPSAKEEIVSLGQPKGQTNSITYGKVLSYISGPDLNCESYLSNVTFEVIKHDAEVNSGSSGGALLNVDLKLIGINYAASHSASTGAFSAGYSIPVIRIKNFLSKYRIDY